MDISRPRSQHPPLCGVGQLSESRATLLPYYPFVRSKKPVQWLFLAGAGIRERMGERSRRGSRPPSSGSGHPIPVQRLQRFTASSGGPTQAVVRPRRGAQSILPEGELSPPKSPGIKAHPLGCATDPPLIHFLQVSGGGATAATRETG